MYLYNIYDLVLLIYGYMYIVFIALWKDINLKRSADML